MDAKKNSSGPAHSEPGAGPELSANASSSLPAPQMTLVATAFTQEQLIERNTPQLALAGRSNVGKSSLINALAGRKALAKVSSTPGKTRSVNYYAINGHTGFIVDLPGYGYAQCGHAERNKWAALIEGYLTSTPGLRGLILLLDARLAPQKLDQEVAAFARSLHLPLLPVLTKADKCKQKTLLATIKAWTPLLRPQPLLITSAQQKTGIGELWHAILAAIA